MVESNPDQDDILEWMNKEGVLQELAVSFLESGFWPQEPLIVVAEDEELFVVEGNRRLAAITLLWRAFEGEPLTRAWASLVEDVSEAEMYELGIVPYLLADSRQEVQAYLAAR